MPFAIFMCGGFHRGVNSHQFQFIPFFLDGNKDHLLAIKMIKEIRRVTTTKRAAKFMKRDEISLDRIFDILAKSREME